MLVTPAPIGSLLLAIQTVELAPLAFTSLFRPITLVSEIFTVVPLVIISSVTIVIAPSLMIVIVG